MNQQTKKILFERGKSADAQENLRQSAKSVDLNPLWSLCLCGPKADPRNLRIRFSLS